MSSAKHLLWVGQLLWVLWVLWDLWKTQGHSSLSRVTHILLPCHADWWKASCISDCSAGSSAQLRRAPDEREKKVGSCQCTLSRKLSGRGYWRVSPIRCTEHGRGPDCRDDGTSFSDLSCV